MANAREIVEKHVKAALEEAAASSYPRDAVARVLFDEVLKLYKMDRSPEDIASELTKTEGTVWHGFLLEQCGMNSFGVRRSICRIVSKRTEK